MPDLAGNPNIHNPAQFADTLTGSCLCGSVKVTIQDRELFTKRRGHICHCANCRKVSGSFAASNLIIEEEKVEIEDQKGTLTKFVDTLWIDISASAVGSNPIKSVTPLIEGKVVLKMGIFPRIPAPEIETFGLHRHDWQGLHPGMSQYKIKALGEML
ncbi:Mss4-like protein [Aspergillus cavernicola]|uniref:Mss4-like protein n=1 Tax=Aspergillus cavernicola TaxID=176166 RepID=A0ABR4IIP6_9EURO